MTVRKGFVITHPKFGVHVGNALGMAFWSKLDPIGQYTAPAWPTKQDAQEYLDSWDLPIDSDLKMSDIKLVEVEIDIERPDGSTYVSMDACARAGLERWNPRPDPLAHVNGG